MTFKKLVLKAINAYYSGKVVEVTTLNKHVIFIWDINNTSLGKYVRIYMKNCVPSSIGYTEKEWRMLHKIDYSESIAGIMKILEDER